MASGQFSLLIAVTRPAVAPPRTQESGRSPTSDSRAAIAFRDLPRAPRAGPRGRGGSSSPPPHPRAHQNPPEDRPGKRQETCWADRGTCWYPASPGPPAFGQRQSKGRTHQPEGEGRLRPAEGARAAPPGGCGEVLAPPFPPPPASAFSSTSSPRVRPPPRGPRRHGSDARSHGPEGG